MIFNTDVEKVPDILTPGEIKQFLERGKELQNEWYPIQAMALLTGMRNGCWNRRSDSFGKYREFVSH